MQYEKIKILKKLWNLDTDLAVLQVILLDTRYHRDPLSSDGTILGDSQWEWLEKELNGPESEITIIASSIQVLDIFAFLYTTTFFL